jgi:hypothetical protein
MLQPPCNTQEKTYNHLVVYFTRTTSVEETPREAAIFDRMFDRFLDGTARQKLALNKFRTNVVGML